MRILELTKKALATLLIVAAMVGCNKNDDPKVDKPSEIVDEDLETLDADWIVVGGDQTGDYTFKGDQTYYIASDLYIPEGSTLTFEAGTNVIASAYTEPEIMVDGNLYSLGEEGNEVTISVLEKYRTMENVLGGVWGGIMGGETTEEVVFTHTLVEYTGAAATANSSSVQLGKLDAGDARYGIFFNNNKGMLYMSHNEFRHMSGEAVYVERGRIALFYNKAAFIGVTSDEAFNFKQGTTGDCGFNLMYSAATNAIKCNNSKQVGDDPQTTVHMYNNTIVNCGWRREGIRGGSIILEKEGRGEIFNNLIVNCRWGVQIGEDGDLEHITVYNHLLFGNTEDAVNGFIHPEAITEDNEFYESVYQGPINMENLDPKFVGFDAANYDYNSLEDYSGFNFHLQADSPAINAGTTEVNTYRETIEIMGQTIPTPQPESYLGAYPAE